MAQTIMDGCTLDEVAKELHISRERARQIQVKALAKCRTILESRGLSLTDLIGEPDHDADDCRIEQPVDVSTRRAR